MVNEAGELRGDRTDQAFWRLFQERGFRKQANSLPAPAMLRSALVEDEDHAAREARDLVEQLESLRFQLCSLYDVPAAPVSGVTGLEW